MIAIEQVSKDFGAVHALRDVSLRIAAGERVAFVGSNGSGKTTLLRAMLGLLRFSGTIRIANEDVSRHPERALAHVAYVPQIAPPLEAPVSEVVRAHAALRQIDPRAVREHASLLGLTLAELERVRMRDLSGGMKQKLLAALALATPAAVMVCDEPTANLDAAARKAFFGALENRPRTGVVVLCSHREEEVSSFVDRVIELRDGRLVRDEIQMRTQRLRRLEAVK